MTVLSQLNTIILTNDIAVSYVPDVDDVEGESKVKKKKKKKTALLLAREEANLTIETVVTMLNEFYEYSEYHFTDLDISYWESEGKITARNEDHVPKTIPIGEIAIILGGIYKQKKFGFYKSILGGDVFFKRCFNLFHENQSEEYIQPDDDTEISDVLTYVGLYSTEPLSEIPNLLEWNRIVNQESIMEAAERMGINSNTTYRNYEKGVRTPDLATVLEIQNQTGATLDDIVFSIIRGKDIDMAYKIQKLRKEHPEITTEKIAETLEMEIDKYLECEKNPDLFSSKEFVLMALLFGVPMEFFRGTESQFSFFNRINDDAYDAFYKREIVEKENYFLDFVMTSKVFSDSFCEDSNQGNGSDNKPANYYCGFLRSQLELFPFNNVFVNIEKYEVVFADENDNLAVVSPFTIYPESIRRIETGYNTITFKAIAQGPFFLNELEKEYVKSKKEDDDFRYPPDHSVKSAAPDFISEIGYEQELYITFFKATPLFIGSQKFLERGGLL